MRVEMEPPSYDPVSCDFSSETRDHAQSGR
jgi:hypothetical protein